LKQSVDEMRKKMRSRVGLVVGGEDAAVFQIGGVMVEVVLKVARDVDGILGWSQGYSP
jgi:hypothetical protein